MNWQNAKKACMKTRADIQQKNTCLSVINIPVGGAVIENSSSESWTKDAQLQSCVMPARFSLQNDCARFAPSRSCRNELRVYIYIYVCVCVYMYLYICMCVYVCVCIYIYICMYVCGPGSSLGIATTTGWTVRDRIPVGTRFSVRPGRPWGPPSLLYNGYLVFPGGKVRAGACCWPLTPF
jgi:hypothetical protein